MDKQLNRTIEEMFSVMDQVKAGTMSADDAHAMVRAGAVVVKAHEVAIQRELMDSRVASHTHKLAIAAE